MVILTKHHVRVFVSDELGIGFYDQFDLADFDNDFDKFLEWYELVCSICEYSLDYYYLF